MKEICYNQKSVSHAFMNCNHESCFFISTLDKLNIEYKIEVVRGNMQKCASMITYSGRSNDEHTFLISFFYDLSR